MNSFQMQQLEKFGHEKIYIDDTHGTNPYDIQLYTIVIVDEFGCGCPVAFCFFNRADEYIFKLLFENVKSKVGEIKTNVFMSDDAPAFYNTWLSVMGEACNRLLCTWHVDCNWSQNLNKITDNEKKALVYSELLVFQRKILSCGEFEQGLPHFIEKLLSDEDTEKFGLYFQKHYANRCEMWAYCYRAYLGINTNMYLESFHKTLKYIYLEGKKVKRLDKTIHALLKLVRDHFFKRLIKLSERTPTDKLQKIARSHKNAALIKPDMVEVIEEKKEFLVMFMSKASEHYNILRVADGCTYESCMRCDKCEICVHIYRCTCTDNIIKMNICKHIHACQLLFFGGSNHEINPGFLDCNREISELLSVSATDQNKISNSEIVIQKCNLLSGVSSRVSYDDDETKYIVKHIDKILDHVHSKKTEINFETIEKVNNCNENLEKQARFFSTKKKSQPKNLLKMPSWFESNAIRTSLLNAETDIINVHSGPDHSYLKRN